jgi:hypothetical protein
MCANAYLVGIVRQVLNGERRIALPLSCFFVDCAKDRSPQAEHVMAAPVLDTKSH